MTQPTYDERTARLLAASGQRIEAARREGIRLSTHCGWCQRPITNAQPRCGAEPWRQQ